ncbi:DUF2247 family protein [Pseudogracilibacillus sp. SO30301A]|uniref:DUF2247 family protein n=1 Tax=Pseudogracilibacillus sp. SO30301A TaxID=3098291 RepID=UPI00300DEE8F
MHISLDVFKQNNIKYDWRTLYVGFKLNKLKKSDISNYAVEFLVAHPDVNNKDIVELAWGDDYIDYESLLIDILQESTGQENILDAKTWKCEDRKWRFCILAYLKVKYHNDYGMLLDRIAEVYADFQYPEDVDSFINYLEPKDDINPANYSKEVNINRLINIFNEFLKQEQQELQNSNSV